MLPFNVEKLEPKKRRIVVDFFIGFSETLIHSYNIFQKVIPILIQILQTGTISIYLIIPTIITSILMVIGHCFVHSFVSNNNGIHIKGIREHWNVYISNYYMVILYFGWIFVFTVIQLLYLDYCDMCLNRRGYILQQKIALYRARIVRHSRAFISRKMTQLTRYIRTQIITFYRNVAWDVLDLIVIEDKERIETFHELCYHNNVPKDLANLIVDFMYDKDLDVFVKTKYDKESDISKKFKDLRPIDIFDMYCNNTVYHGK